MMIWLIGIKLVINLGIATSVLRSAPGLALMFCGFAVADAGSFWVALSAVRL